VSRIPGKHSNNWGGSRPNSGRPKGSINKTTEQAISMAANARVHPYQFLLDCIDNPELSLKERANCAAAALPYCQSKLSYSEHTVTSKIEGLSHREKLLMAHATAARIFEHSPDIELPQLPLINGVAENFG
jgi:hypothetical protein